MPYAPDHEIFDLLAQRLRAAAEKCEALAWDSRRGFVYATLCKDFKEIEGCCRQVAARRDDACWLQYGMQIARIHKMCGNWLRSSPTKEARAAVHPLFQKTAEILRGIEYQAEKRKTQRTNRIGMILPRSLEGPHRDTRPVSLSGLILPPTYH